MGTGVCLFTLLTPDVRHALVRESWRSECVCLCVCARRGAGETKISHHHQLSSLPPSCSLITLSCMGQGWSPTFPQQEAKEAQLVHLPGHVLVELVSNGGGGPWHKEAVFSLG